MACRRRRPPAHLKLSACTMELFSAITLVISFDFDRPLGEAESLFYPI